MAWWRQADLLAPVFSLSSCGLGTIPQRQRRRMIRTPESARPSLRVLARQIGASCQLLSHYLERWEKWQATEHRRAARQIRARAEAENRSVTPLEERDAK